MAVWDEQNMIALSIESTKNIIYEYIVIIKKGIDDTKKIVELCKNKWDLNIRIIESEMKLREARKYACEISKDYADYYLIQDGDEIYYTTEELKSMNMKTIPELIEENYSFCLTTMIYLKGDLLNTTHNLTWIIPHAFLFINIPDEIIWENAGDMPSLKYNYNYKIFNEGNNSKPYKFDCVVKNFRRIFLRNNFTLWHDDDNYNGTIEQYSFENDLSIRWYLDNIDKDETSLEKIISYYEKSSDINKYYLLKKYNENEYCVYPKIIRKYIDLGLIRGITNISDFPLISDNL